MKKATLSSSGVDEEITGDPPSLYVDEIRCHSHLRQRPIPGTSGMANTSCECVHSPWSETWSVHHRSWWCVTAISLLSPDEGALGVLGQ